MAAPEVCPDTYAPDDSPVTYIQTQNGAVFTSEANKNAGFKKTLEIKTNNDETIDETIDRL